MLTYVNSAEARICVLNTPQGYVSGPGWSSAFWSVNFLFTDAPLAEDFSCDSMGRDFLDAEDFTYPEHGPNIHHWNSIEHFKVDGTIVGVNSDKLSRALSVSASASVNVFNDTHLPIFQIIGKQELSHYCMGIFEVGQDLRCVISYPYAVVPISERFFGIAYLSSVTAAWRHKDGTWSWSYSNDDSRKLTITSSNFIVYELSSDLRRYRTGRLGYTFSVEASASPTAGETLAKLLLASLKVALQRNLKKVVLSQWSSNYRVGDVSGIRMPEIHRPNQFLFNTSGRKYYNWSALAGSAYQSLGMADVNGIAYLKDLFEFGSAATSFANTLKSIPSKKVKAAAAAWLSVHYGFKLFISDTKEILRVLEKETARRSSLSRCAAFEEKLDGDIAFCYGYQVYYDQWAKVRSMLEQTVTLFDLGLNLDNIWDMVPYSFVIDWFVDVGSVLKSLQNYAQLAQEHSLICAGRSIKAITKLRSSQLGLNTDDFTVTGMISYYTRQYRDRLVIPSLIPSVTFNPFDHLIEAAALTIVRVAP